MVSSSDRGQNLAGLNTDGLHVRSDSGVAPRNVYDIYDIYDGNDVIHGSSPIRSDPQRSRLHPTSFNRSIPRV